MIRPGSALAIAVVVAQGSGCSHGTIPEPAGPLRQYLAAIGRDDPHLAYSLLSESLRARVSERDFAARWRATTAERQAQAGALHTQLDRAQPIEQRAEVRLSDGRLGELTRESSRWRLLTPRLAAPGASSPTEALEKLVQALDAHDFDAILEQLSDPLRELVERELSSRLLKLKAAAEKKVSIEGERAKIRYDNRYYIEFKEENGHWRVSDFN
jgi:hypothetical protein